LGLGGPSPASSLSYASQNFGASNSTYGGSSSGGGSSNFSFLPSAQNTGSSFYNNGQQQLHHNNSSSQQQHQQFKHQYQHQQSFNGNNNNNESSASNMLSSLFNADQLLKFASGLEHMEKEMNPSSLPEFNFDLIGSSAGSENINNFYDELDLKLSIDNSNQHMQQQLAYHSSSSSASSANFNHFLDVNNYTSSSSKSGGEESGKSSGISPSESPKHQHDTSSSLSTDSGCRSNSFLNDEDSAICSLALTSSNATSLQIKSSSSSSSSFSVAVCGGDNGEKRENSKKKEDTDFCVSTISEHLEFTCSNSSPVKPINEEKQHHHANRIDEEEDEDEDDLDDDNNGDCSSDCDTSVDASDMPDENLSTTSSSDDLNDLDLDFELAAAEENASKQDMVALEPLLKFNQVLESDGTVLRKKLNSGIYKSVNETASLFIEPHDVLKRMEMNEFDEYSLFPHGHNNEEFNFEDNLDSLVDDAAALLVINKF
jgi:hypothetical protein